MADMMERYKNVLNWTHPGKTALVFAGMLVGVVVTFVMPTKWWFACGVAGVFGDGLTSRLKKRSLVTQSGKEVMKQKSLQHQVCAALSLSPFDPDPVALRNANTSAQRRPSDHTSLH